MNEPIKKNQIGEIIYKNYISENTLTKNEIKDKIENANFELLSNIQVVSLCILPNDQILATDKDSIHIFDEKFKEIKNIKVPEWTSVGCSLSPKNEIYISDYTNSCINVFDLSLQKINKFGSKGNGNYQFDGIYRIIWRNGYLYVCDRWNRRIQTYDINLNFFDSIKLDYIPWSIEVLNKTIGVCGNEGTYFYNLDDKSLINEYDKLFGGMNLINSKFYVTVYQPTPHKVKCYDRNGKLCDEFHVNSRINQFIEDPYYYQIFAFKKNLVFFSYRCLK